MGKAGWLSGLWCRYPLQSAKAQSEQSADDARLLTTTSPPARGASGRRGWHGTLSGQLPSQHHASPRLFMRLRREICKPNPHPDQTPFPSSQPEVRQQGSAGPRSQPFQRQRGEGQAAAL